MSENVLLYAPPVKIETPNEISCVVESAIGVTDSIYTTTIFTTGTVYIAKKTYKIVSANPFKVRFKKSGRFKMKISESVVTDYPHASRFMQAFYNDSEEVFLECCHSGSVKNYVATSGDKYSDYINLTEGDTITFKFFAGTDYNGATFADNQICLDNSGNGEADPVTYSISMSLGRSVASVVDEVLTVTNEIVTDIFDYIEIIN